MRAINPANGKSFGPEFFCSTRAQLEAMGESAIDAVDFLADAPGAQIAGFLDDYAVRLEGDRAQ